MADENHPMTIRLSPDRFERLRLEAFERRVSMSAIVGEALDEHAERRWPALAQDKRVVRHKDGDPRNNDLGNLEITEAPEGQS
jgi:hypothetical protein